MHMQRIGGKVVGGGARRRRWAAACLFLLCAPGFWGYAACSHAGAAEGRIRLKTRASASEGGVGVGEEGTNTRADAPGGTDESWRDKAAERLGLVRSGNRLNLGPGSEAALTASRSARAGGKTGEKARAGQTTTALPNSVCNITIACHVCPEAAMRDNADYCLSTGWRHQLRCVNEEGVEVEVRFESCTARGVVVSGYTSVLQMEAMWAAVFLCAWVWLQKRRSLQASSRAADKKGAYVPMTASDV